MTEEILLLAGLGAAAIQDVKWKRVWLPMLWIITFVVILKKYWEGTNIFAGVFCSACCILFFIIIHKCTQGQIGVADAFIFGMTGSALGWKNNLILMYTTFFLAFVFCLFLVVLWKKSKRYEVPLAPFVLLSYLLVG